MALHTGILCTSVLCLVSLCTVNALAQQAGPVTVQINTAKTAEPISPYIYGQFIEHLGWCIYGGIWAEMLEDRKFFYAVAAKESPWKTLGGNAAVSMVKDNAYVGAHTPQITLSSEGSPAGITQGALALLKDRRYVGRIVLAGDPSAAPVLVSLIWGNDSSNRQTITIDTLTPEFAKTPLNFTAGSDCNNARIEIVGRGKGNFRVGTVSLMPADNIHGMRADTLKLLKELNAPIYRWPGGNFVSGYNWKDGIGDPDRRPPRKNPAWKGVEHNDFGIDEYMLFCREIATEPLVVVNTGLGNVTLATEMVQYANGPSDTPMGSLRAKNGHTEPYKVRYWGIGNEMYGNWQLGHMPLEKYVQKHNTFVDAMRTIDPSIKCVAVGAVGPWSETTLRHCANHMDLMSEHFYCHEKKDLIEHVRQIPDNVRRIAHAHREYRKKIDTLKGKDIRIAMDEWNYWYGPDLYGEIGTRYFLKDALGIAMGLNEYYRNTDIIFMANYAQTVNVIGAIKTSKTAAEFDTTGLVLKLYRQQFGSIPVSCVTEAAPLDVMAALTTDRKTLTVSVVNPTTEKRPLMIDLKGYSVAGPSRLWRITGADPMAYNEPGKPQRVRIEESSITADAGRLETPPLSVSVYALPVR